MKKNLLRFMICLFITAMLLTALTSCGTPIPTRKAEKVVATVGGMDILYDELYFVAMNGIEQFKLDYGEDAMEDPARREELVNFVWEHLATRETALLLVGRDYGFDPLEGELAASVSEYIDSVIEENYGGSTSKYVQGLNEAYLTDRYARISVAVEYYLADAIVNKMITTGEIDISDEAARELINGENFIRTVHVFISKTNQLYTAAENLAHAESISRKLQGITDDSARYKAMREAIGGPYNNDFNDTTGNGYYFAKGEMESAYEEAAFALDEYGASGVVETSEGYYVIMRMPKDETYIEDHFQLLKEKTYFIKLNDMVDALLPTLKVEPTDFGKELVLTALEPIDANGGKAFYIVTAVIVVVICAAVVVFVMSRIQRKKRKNA